MRGVWATREPKVTCWRSDRVAGLQHVIVIDPVLPWAESSTNQRSQWGWKQHQQATRTRVRSSTTPLHMLHVMPLLLAAPRRLADLAIRTFFSGCPRRAVVNGADIISSLSSFSARRSDWSTVGIAPYCETSKKTRCYVDLQPINKGNHV